MNVAVFEAIKAQEMAPSLAACTSVHLANGGVGLADVAGASAELKAELEAVKQGHH
jgi:hypothetical protein